MSFLVRHIAIIPDSSSGWNHTWKSPAPWTDWFLLGGTLGTGCYLLGSNPCHAMCDREKPWDHVESFSAQPNLVILTEDAEPSFTERLPGSSHSLQGDSKHGSQSYVTPQFRMFPADCLRATPLPSGVTHTDLCDVLCCLPNRSWLTRLWL